MNEWFEDQANEYLRSPEEEAVHTVNQLPGQPNQPMAISPKFNINNTVYLIHNGKAIIGRIYKLTTEVLQPGATSTYTLDIGLPNGGRTLIDYPEAALHATMEDLIKSL